MEISIKKELECQALLAYRFAQNIDVHYNPDESDRVTYQLTKSDPLPEGMVSGEFIYGVMTEFETEEDRGADLAELPVFTGTGS